MEKLTYIGLVFGAVVGFMFGGALLTEYVLKIGVLGTSNLEILCNYRFSGGRYHFSHLTEKALTVAVFIGCILIPYAAFMVGQIDFYMVDDNLAQGITVVEVRPTMNKIVFGTPDKGDVVVWGRSADACVASRENRVKLGRFDMPAGTYKGGSVSYR